MKNLLTIITLSFILFFACTKQENRGGAESSNSNSAQMISNSKGLLFGIKVSVGHDGANCSGCVTIGGQQVHTDCQGRGNACQVGARMQISDSGEINFYYGTIDDPEELTDGEFFLMPDRSLYIVGSNGEFINIPEQTVYRDEETGTFIFYDVFFSDSQVFENK